MWGIIKRNFVYILHNCFVALYKPLEYVNSVWYKKEKWTDTLECIEKRLLS